MSAGPYCVDFEELSKPSLARGLGICQLLLACVNSQPQSLLGTREGIYLLVSLANCVEMVASSNSFAARSFVDICSAVSSHFTVEMLGLVKRGGNSEPSTGCSISVSVTDFVQMVNILAANTRLFASAALNAKKVVSPTSSTPSKPTSGIVPSALLQCIAQAAASTALISETEIDGSESLLAASSADHEPLPAADQLGLATGVRTVRSGFGVQKAVADQDATSADTSEEVTWGPEFAAGHGVSSSSDQHWLSKSHFVKVGALWDHPHGDIGSACLSVGVGLLPTAEPLLRWSTRLREDGKICGAIRLGAEVSDFAAFCVGDILSFTLIQRSDGMGKFMIAKNGIGLAVVDVAIDVSAPVAVQVTLAPGSELWFLADIEVPDRFRESVCEQCQAHHIANADPSLLDGFEELYNGEFEGMIITKWDVSLSDSSLLFSESSSTVQRPGSISCFPASLATVSGSASITVHLTSAPLGKNPFSFGIASKASFRATGSDGFGVTSNSWGIIQSRAGSHALIYADGEHMEDVQSEAEAAPVLESGCMLALRYEQSLGKCWMWYGENLENCYEFIIHAPGDRSQEIVMGATYGNVSNAIVIP
jgi:hypothetical protein